MRDFLQELLPIEPDTYISIDSGEQSITFHSVDQFSTASNLPETLRAISIRLSTTYAFTA